MKQSRYKDSKDTIFDFPIIFISCVICIVEMSSICSNWIKLFGTHGQQYIQIDTEKCKILYCLREHYFAALKTCLFLHQCSDWLGLSPCHWKSMAFFATNNISKTNWIRRNFFIWGIYNHSRSLFWRCIKSVLSALTVNQVCKPMTYMISM